MKNNLKILFRIFTFIILLTNSKVVFASAATTNFLVTATVLPACTVTALPLPFGNYTSATDVFLTTTITVTCTNGTGYHIYLDGGQAGSVTARQMKGATVGNTTMLNYALYSDTARTVNWGNTSSTSVSSTGTGIAQPFTVYGAIPAGQTTVKTDTYSDTINVTINIP